MSGNQPVAETAIFARRRHTTLIHRFLVVKEEKRCTKKKTPPTIVANNNTAAPPPRTRVSSYHSIASTPVRTSLPPPTTCHEHRRVVSIPNFLDLHVRTRFRYCKLNGNRSDTDYVGGIKSIFLRRVVIHASFNPLASVWELSLPSKTKT